MQETHSDKLPMTPKRRDMCLHVTRKLSRRPCAACFTSSSGDEINLTMIEERLVNNEYEFVEDWDSDFQMIFYNTEKFNGEDPYLVILSQALARNFRRMKRRLDIQGWKGWVTRLTELEKKVVDMIGKPCDALQPFVGEDVVTPDLEPLSEGDIKALFKAVKMLTRPSDILFINNVLMAFTKLNVKNETLNVDVRQLPTQAQRFIRSYAMQRLGSEYPQP